MKVYDVGDLCVVHPRAYWSLFVNNKHGWTNVVRKGQLAISVVSVHRKECWVFLVEGFI